MSTGSARKGGGTRERIVRSTAYGEVLASAGAKSAAFDMPLTAKGPPAAIAASGTGTSTNGEALPSPTVLVSLWASGNDQEPNQTCAVRSCSNVAAVLGHSWQPQLQRELPLPMLVATALPLSHMDCAIQSPSCCGFMARKSPFALLAGLANAHCGQLADKGDIGNRWCQASTPVLLHMHSRPQVRPGGSTVRALVKLSVWPGAQIRPER